MADNEGFQDGTSRNKKIELNALRQSGRRGNTSQKSNEGKVKKGSENPEAGYCSAPEESSQLISSTSNKRSTIRHHVPSYSGIERLEPIKKSKSLQSLPSGKDEEDSYHAIDDLGNDRKHPEKLRTFKNATLRQKMTLVCLSVADFNMFLCVALMAPFFPKEAEDHGVTSIQSGWVFGIFAVVKFLTSPFYGKLLPILGPRFVFFAGNFFTGGCIMLFGTLEYFPYNTTIFLVFAFIIRIFLALGCTAVVCSNFVIASSTFPDNSSFVLGLMESMIGFGMMMGPAIGGVIHQGLGFKGPFFTTGGFIWLTTIGFAFIMDFSLSVKKESSKEEDSRNLIRRLLSVPTITIVLFSAVTSSMTWLIYDPILEPHLRKFHLSSSGIGGMFLLLAATYAICSPVVGKTADSMRNSTPLIVAGHLVGCTAMLLIGPSPLIGLGGYNKLWLNMVALILTGLSISLTLVPTYGKILAAANGAGIDESFHVHSIIGGLWTSSLALGEFVGPTLAGWAVSVTSFDHFLTFYATGCFCMAIIMASLWIYEHRKKRQLSSINQ